ncbi:MAG TPA: efflux transporter outer membrane subunit [Casimicrobiaceae bacterium]|nr:efflux transporter outer membrane subunit [Casimicrobiaceae bacterium]
MRNIAIVLMALLAGCSLAPKFERPETETPAQFKELTPAERGSWKTAQPAEEQPRGEWWRAFHDPALDQLEADAIAANQTLKAAAARVSQARALVGVAKSDRIPRVDAGFGPSRAKLNGASLGLPPGTDVAPFTTWSGLITVSYEVDLFGRISDNINAARSDYEGSEATFRSVQLALQADVAQTYFALRETDEELTLLRNTVGLREDSARLLQRRFDLGDIGELDVARARTELATTRSDAIALERQRAQLEHALAVLLGKPAPAFSLAPAPLASAMPAIPAGLPSSLLERRPDIAAASRTMAAANSRIGIAKAAFFPVLNLTAQGGFESAELGDLFKWSSRTWALGPLVGTILAMPLIDGGRNRANLDRSYAVLEESVAGYRQQVLVAFAEVEDNLANVRTLDDQAQATRDAVASAARALRIAQVRYNAGATGYLDAIDAQRSLLSMQRLETQIKGARATSTVALIRALGGGWNAAAPVLVGSR